MVAPLSTETMGAWGEAEISTFHMREIISWETQPIVTAFNSLTMQFLENSFANQRLQVFIAEPQHCPQWTLCTHHAQIGLIYELLMDQHITKLRIASIKN